MNLNLFSIAGLVLNTTCFILILIILIYGKTRLHRIWALFNFAIGIWGISAFFIGKASTPQESLFWLRIGHIGVIFIPILFLHVVYLLCEISNKKLLFLAYSQGVIFLLLSPTTLFLSQTQFVFKSFYYTKSEGLVYPIFFLIWMSLVSYGVFKLIEVYRSSKGLKHVQINYFLLGTVIGFTGGITNFLPHFGIMFYPLGNLTILLYCVIVTYAILKYRLMDIRVAVTRAGIFVIVYAFVLGMPFYLGYKYSLWMLATWITAVLASAGPFIFIFFRRRAEDIILKEQRRYQHTLRELSATMTKIRDLDQLVKAIALTVVNTVKISFVRIYLRDDDARGFRLNQFYPKQSRLGWQELIAYDSDLAKFILANKRPLSPEEAGIDKVFPGCGLVIPCFMDESLLGFMILGAKSNDHPYTSDDILEERRH